MEASALRNVFGSNASLAELSGDTLPSEQPKSGYSRFGLNEHPQPHQMHTKTRRLSVSQRSMDFVPKRRWKWWQSLAIFMIFGVAQTWFMQMHIPFIPSVYVSHQQRQFLFALGVLFSVIAGFVVPSTDRSSNIAGEKRPTVPNSPTLGRPDSRSSKPGSAGSTSSISQAVFPSSLASPSHMHWTHALTRGYGALLGLIYLTQKLSSDAIIAWILITPGIWLVGDGTLNGLLIAVSVALIGAFSTFYLTPGMLASLQSIDTGSYSFLYLFASTAVAFFGTSLMAGNVGRGFRQ